MSKLESLCFSISLFQQGPYWGGKVLAAVGYLVGFFGFGVFFSGGKGEIAFLFLTAAY